MSIFSKLRGAKKDAVVHKKADTAATSGDQAVQKPAKYRHIPTHAAIDALSGAPSSWKAEDRSKIQAQNKRRSAMVTRNNSGYSTPTLARNSSYNGSSWGNEGRPTPHNGTMFRQYDAGVGRSSPLASHGTSTCASKYVQTRHSQKLQISPLSPAVATQPTRTPRPVSPCPHYLLCRTLLTGPQRFLKFVKVIGPITTSITTSATTPVTTSTTTPVTTPITTVHSKARPASSTAFTRAPPER